MKDNNKLLKIIADIAALLPGLKPLASNFKRNEEYKQMEGKIKDIKNLIEKRNKNARNGLTIGSK